MCPTYRHVCANNCILWPSANGYKALKRTTSATSVRLGLKLDPAYKLMSCLRACGLLPGAPLPFNSEKLL
eukprot:941023-Amphidinium_carterae.1